jgi:hypothetical protein
VRNLLRVQFGRAFVVPGLLKVLAVKGARDGYLSL